MRATSRRSLIKTLAGLPVFTALSRLNVPAFDPRGRVDQAGDAFDDNFLAIQVLRWVNTAQRCHFEASGQYTEPRNLLKVEKVRQFMERVEHARRNPKPQFERNEIVPGWRFRFALEEKERRRYLVTMQRTAGAGGGALSSDETGVIFEGDRLSPTDSTSAWPTAGFVLAGGTVIGTDARRSRGVTAFLRTVALGGPFPQGGCCNGCCSDCSCKGKYNCGCVPCTWCDVSQ